MKRFIILSILSVPFFCACSSSETAVQQDEKKEPSVYVFDDVSKVDTAKTEEQKQPEKIPEVKEQKPEPATAKTFVVQIGAFTSKERAESFVKENQNKIEQQMNISFSSQVQLYVVQLPSLATREEAEKVRNDLWKIPSFKDAFIITVDSQK